ncbi:hypothetical protein MTO96_043006 [Rhipicephalus appendiculatus]
MSAQRTARAEITKKRGPDTRRKPGTRHKRPRHARPTPAALEMPSAKDQAGAEAVPRHPYAPGPSEHRPGPIPSTGRKASNVLVATWTFQAGTRHPLRTSRRCREVHHAKDESRLFALFWGRTITDIDRQARGA